MTNEETIDQRLGRERSARVAERRDPTNPANFRRYEVGGRNGYSAVDVYADDPMTGRPAMLETAIAGLTRKEAAIVAGALSSAFRAGARWRTAQTARQRISVMGGGRITCANCQTLGASDPDGDMFIEWPRSLDSFDYECARCGAHTHPYTETGASR